MTLARSYKQYSQTELDEAVAAAEKRGEQRLIQRLTDEGSSTHEPLTHEAIRNLSASEINARWDEVTAVLQRKEAASE